MQSSNSIFFLTIRLSYLPLVVFCFIWSCHRSSYQGEEFPRSVETDLLVGILVEHTGITDKYIEPLIFSSDSINYMEKIVKEVLYISSPGIPSYSYVNCTDDFLEKIKRLTLDNNNAERKGNELKFGSIRVSIVYDKHVDKINIFDHNQSKKMIKALVQEIVATGSFTPKEIAQCEMMYCHLNKAGWPCMGL